MSTVGDYRAWLALRWKTLSRHHRIAFIALPVLLVLAFVILLRVIATAAALDQTSSGLEQDNSATLVPLTIQARLAEHTSDVMTLQRWLLNGRNLEDQARVALSMLEQLQFIAADPALPDAWQRYSAELLQLELDVQDQRITTPEAIALIDALRGDYETLRERADALPGDVQQTVVDPAPKVDQMFAAQQRSLSRWLYTLLPLLLLSMAVVGWLFYLSSQPQQTQPNPRMRTVDSRANQNAILQLLDEMEPLADGDLRVKATVSEAMTGALADAFNHAVTELRWLVGAIKGSAAQVNESVSNTRESANNLAQASAVQAREIHRSSNYLNVMSDTMAQLSAHAAESSRIAVDSVKQAQVGTLAVDANVKGLVNIREQAQMTSRLMERLVESSDAIKKHVNEIQRVAKNTDLLALNTTIRAAAASGGDQTTELSQLSAEVTHLASTLGMATRDIGNLAGVIQQDAALTLTSVKKTNRELDVGHQKAIQASHSLKAIEAVSDDLQNQINDMASKTLRQAGVVRQLSANMGVINGITRDSAVGLQDAASDLEDLQTMANALLQSVSGFTLPESEVEYVPARTKSVKRRLAATVSADHHSQKIADIDVSTLAPRVD